MAWRRTVLERMRIGLIRVAVLCLVLVGLPASASVPAPEPLAPPPRTLVSLTFNDGLLSQFQYAAPVLAAHHIPATFYVVSDWVDQARTCCMAWWQLDGLYRAGHEIGGMGSEHQVLTAEPAAPWPTDKDNRRREVCDDHDRLTRRGYAPVSFAYPGGSFATAFPDASTPQDIVRSCGYLSARAVGGLGPMSRRTAIPMPPPDPLGLQTHDVNGTGPVDLADLERAVLEADRRGGGWLPFAFDKVCRRDTPEYADCMISPRALEDTTLDSFLTWLGKAGLPDGAPAGTVAKTMRDVLEAPAPPPLPPRQTIVSLTFDDGAKSQYLVRPVLSDRTMHATFYVNTSLVDRADGSAMTWEQLRDLAADGNDIGGHTLHHANLAQLPSAAARREEICADRQRLVDEGFDAVSFAYPFASIDPESRGLVGSCGYQSARTGGGVSPGGRRSAERLPPPDPFATAALNGVDGPIPLSFLQSAVETAAGHGGGWVQIVFHGVCRASDADYSACMSRHRPVDLGIFTQFVSWLDSQAPRDTVVMSVAEAMRQ